jgi:predicted aspartyl protease
MVVLRGDLVFAPVSVNGDGPFLFLVDTGATTTLVSESLARRLDLKTLGTHPIYTLAGSRTTARHLVDRLQIGDETVSRVEVLASSLEGVQAVEPAVAGVLGQDVLGSRNYLLDYANRRLAFDPDGAVRAGLSGIPVPLSYADERPMLTGVIWTGDRERVCLRLVLDSAATDLLLLEGTSHPAVRRAMDGSARTAAARVLSTHAGARAALMMIGLDELIVPTAVLRGLTAAVIPLPSGHARQEDGLLPTRLFRAIYVDNRERTVLLNPPLRAAPGTSD